MSPKPNLIPLSRSVLPPLEELHPLLEAIWDSKILTNCGPFHQRFEAALGDYLGVERVSLVANATLGLSLALRAIGRTVEVITTPFSFVATSHAISWAGMVPVFVDIDRCTLNLDPEKLEAAINERTTAILPVHTFGTPCDTRAIESVANRHGIPVVYDAAHAFGVSFEDESILREGACSILSFHASKVFSTFEGGAVVSGSDDLKRKLDRMRNFGIADGSTWESTGLNAKMSEIHAAIGLLQLRHVDDAIRCRELCAEIYRSGLASVRGIELLASQKSVRANFGYFPVLVSEGGACSADELCTALGAKGISTRRYFHPLLSTLPMYRDLPSAASNKLPVATDVAARVLCLPIFPGLSEENQAFVIDSIRECCT